MKNTNLTSRSAEQIKFKSGDINAMGQGVTRRLLEKYKPKYYSNMEKMRDRSTEKRVA